MINHIDEEGWEEIISYFAKRGDTDTIDIIRKLMKQLTEYYYDIIDDPDYETEESISSEEEGLEYEEELIAVKMDGDFYYCE